MKKPNNIQRTILRTLLLLAALAPVGVWGQETDYSGVYYIGSRGYVEANTTTNFYLCPTEGWAFYVATNNVQGSDNDQPFLTTYKCRNGSYDATKAAWIVEKEPISGCYYIKQAITGRYVVSNGVLTGAGSTRARVHLETIANATALAALGDLALFEITYDVDHYDIKPHSTYGRDGNNIYLVVNTNNYNQLDGNNSKTNGPTGYRNCGGIIGLYTHPDNGNAYFYLEEAVQTPVIVQSLSGSDAGEVTITCATSGTTIYYTTDGSDPVIPTTGSPTSPTYVYTTPFSPQAGTDTIKAIAAMTSAHAIQSRLTKYATAPCPAPVISYNSTTGEVSITAISGATIYYTTDGTTPVAGTSSQIYGGSFVINDLTTIKAIATHNGFLTSSVVQRIYGANLPVAADGAYLISSADEFQIFLSMADGGGETEHYRITTDISVSNVTTITTPFSGILEAAIDNNTHRPYTISGVDHPIFTTLNGGTVKNLTLNNVNITGSGNTGSICNEATGASRIYNCGVLATNSTVDTDKNGYTIITSCSSTISGSGYVGGIVGLLDGTSRVINCFSYANITGGSSVGGIVGYNNQATTSAADNQKTMVMNCMFYGDITGGSSKAPIYNGEIITNDGDANGVNNFNYFWSGASYVQGQHIDVYNCALAAETRFLQRFEFFRHLLNSNRELAAWWATGNTANKNEMMKWVMEPSQIGTTTPYPILKAPDRYPSVVNIDVNHSETYNGRDMTVGPKFNNTLSVTIRNSTTDAVYGAPTGADITTTSLSLKIMDKDPDHFNFNYYKVQLPYYNDVGTGNYTGNRVVTGWKIVSISSGTNNFTTGSDATATVNDDGDITLTTPYNFADRKCTPKDLYGTGGSNRIFSQGAYFDVPEGVTSITIEPYWGKAVYLSDAYWDVTYQNGTGTDTKKAGSTIDAMTTPVNVTSVGGDQHYNNGVSTFNDQLVYTSMGNAIASSGSALFSGVDANNHSVYDYAVVLVGNYHHNTDLEASNAKPFTITSVDLDGDNEPDYSYILRFNGRLRVHPVRIDFLNAIGLGMAQKTTGGTGTYNFGIMQPKGWFEATNTGLFRVTQFEYDFAGRVNSPMILQGGVIEQWVTVGGSEQSIKEGKTVTYYHVGGNVWFKEFHIGVHQDKTQNEFVSPHPPISVTGGDYNEFYLTGLYNTPNANYDDNAECYINGGRFGKVAGTAMQGIGAIGGNSKGSIIWQINNADIDEFYAGGINAAHIAEGSIYTVISNSRVDQFCGGPKFGDMNSDKKVVTNATNCTFRTFFGAGYGGNSYNRRYPSNQNNKININWNSWLTGAASYDYSYDADYHGVETRIDYQFLPMSSNVDNVCRLFIDYISFSLATTYDVTSKLTGCTITKSALGGLDLAADDERLGNFYGGGSLGKVAGPVKSTLINCTVEGNVFGAGYSATMPKVNVMANNFQTQPHYDENLGAYLDAVLPATTEYEWEHAATVNSTATAINTSSYKLYTEEDLSKSNLGSVEGNAILTLQGTTRVEGSVYGGGDQSVVKGANKGNTTVILKGKANVFGNVYGGGNKGPVEGDSKVLIQDQEIQNN